eukprot:TRINITY_DN2194_c0_g1_i2.p1 TRINITY_DN2194_c0_g1~~TRINITY_DN2194_c0_g1_i2.p1  ORF type:complete len:203 (-),score=36.12 TRINITY_DN2194_c0_g1_i2:3-611(-)
MNESPPASSLVNMFPIEVMPLIKGKKVILVGYSTGGMLMMKHLEYFRKEGMDPRSFGIFIGVSPHPDPSLLDGIYHFWTPDTMKQTGKDKVMKKLHGTRWEELMIEIRSWFIIESSLWLNERECQLLFNDPSMFLILGEKDEPFAPQIHLSGNCICRIDPAVASSRIAVVPSGHFTYFSSNWDVVEAAMKLFILTKIKPSKL